MFPGTNIAQEQLPKTGNLLPITAILPVFGPILENSRKNRDRNVRRGDYINHNKD
jgi:hypothetical protein